MRRIGDELVVSPTDLTKFLGCAHATALDLQVLAGTRGKPFSYADELLDLLIAKGIEHEVAYLARLRDEFEVVEVDQDGRSPGQRAADTAAAMRAGAAVIYQAAFLHHGRVGYADFLLRIERSSELGAWSYDVADTKLARRLKVPALLQMAAYGEHLRRLQGKPPVTLTVVAGDGTLLPFAFADVEAYARRVTSRFDAFIAAPGATVAEPVEQCAQCSWAKQCDDLWRAADHLSYVAFLGGRQRSLIEEAGITTVAQLAAASPDALPRQISSVTRARLIRQAALQVQERESGQPHYELLDPFPKLGLLALPEPDAADLYLDFESDRYAETDGLEYLAGIGTNDGTFTPLWAHSVGEEKRLTVQLIDRILAAWRTQPGMHVYHYAPYEPSALKRLVARHGTREAELDILLRAEVFVDLYAVVRQGLLVSKESYSIKKLEAFYWSAERHRNTEVAEAVSSVLEYEKWLKDHDQALLDRVVAYNKDDVDSTRDLHGWLEARRAELCAAHNTKFPREYPDSEATYDPSDNELAEIALAEDLVEAGQPLLAGLVGWHRREARPQWWEFYRYKDLSSQELVDDATPIGQLGAPQLTGTIARSNVWRYPFPPQETKLRVGDNPAALPDHSAAGEIVGLDLAAGWVELKVGMKSAAPELYGLQPAGPIRAAAAQAALSATGRLVLRGETNLGTRLLERVVPAALPASEGESPADALLRIGTQLNGEVLAVQGPPGSGKSYVAAKLIRALIKQGKTVGVTALSHVVIGGLLNEVKLPGLQKAAKAQWCGNPRIEHTDTNAKIEAAVRDRTHTLFAGTAWLWSRVQMKDSVDVLVIDEAGQFSLADAVAVAQAARSLVLLGDPQQLTQPTQAQHPHGAGVSALEYLIGEHHTIAADRGIFFDTTWRMHPDVNAFVSRTSYDNRLDSHPSTAQQRIAGDGPLSGTGLRYVPVEHRDNSTGSPEEADVIADLVERLLATSWTSFDGVTSPVTVADILIVAPYNVQVGVLRERLRPRVDAGLRIGTVDKFQGRQGAVVIYSTTSSTAADAPRGLDFLYDTNRLNVAISRARAMAIMVGSPALLDAAAAKPETVPMINAYCRFAEMATHVEV